MMAKAIPYTDEHSKAIREGTLRTFTLIFGEIGSVGMIRIGANNG